MSFAQEMRLWDSDGKRLYINTEERAAFMNATKYLNNAKHRMLCEVIHWTGCRISEALELSPGRINVKDKSIIFRTLKQRSKNKNGDVKKPSYRAVPVPAELIENLDLVFKIRNVQRANSKRNIDSYLWANQRDPLKHISRVTAWRIVAAVLKDCNIKGPHASPKGFRHGFGVAMTLAGMDVYKLRDRLGHASAETTEIYRAAVGKDDHKLQMQYWDKI